MLIVAMGDGATRDDRDAALAALEREDMGLEGIVDQILWAVVPLVEARVRRDITRQIEAMRREFADTLDGDNWKQTRDTLDEVLALVEQRVEADHA